ncbi:uncharacterized protein LOC119727201 [Patiria miniata]|uniref:Protein crumbs homolog 2 n=1 Tax=Patiria miniata TaxID=46514 RepID=A0A913ZUQ8_PATMI|nr:uncharacterized protein LOC119727201 [Patiria miniata]
MFCSSDCKRVSRQTSENEVLPGATGEIRESAARLGALISPLTERPTELVFVLDATQSVRAKRFKQVVKPFARDVASLFSHASNRTRPAVVAFASCQKVETGVDFIGASSSSDFSKCDFLESLEAVDYIGGPGSCLGGGMMRAYEILEAARPGSERLVVLLTDGRSRGEDSPTEYAQRMRTDGTNIVAFGIGKGANKKELVAIATADRMFRLDKWEDLQPLAAVLTEEIPPPRPTFLYVDTDRCSGLCAAENGPCCDSRARCACQTDSGRFECVCQPGYIGDGSVGNCSAVPVTEKFCLTPVPPSDGGVVCDDLEYSIGTECSFSCKEGFVLANNAPITCELTEEGRAVWNGLTPGCEAIPDIEQFCGVPNSPTDGQVVCDDSAYSIGATCSFVCDEGFLLDNDGPITCEITEDGQAIWRGAAPECEAIPVTEKFCAVPSSPADGQVVCNDQDYSIGTECSFTCNEGFQLANDGPIICNVTEDGQAMWRGGTPECEAIPVTESFCIAPNSPTNGQVVCADPEYSIGTECSLNCNEGFQLANDEPIICEITEDGEPVWSSPTLDCEAVPVIEQFCAVPSFPANGQVVCDDSDHIVGTVCSFICSKGFVLSNDGPIVCEITEDGEAVWIGHTPECDDLPPPFWLNCPNNTVVPTDHRRPSATVTWTVPQAQSSGQLTVASTAEPPVVLRIGTTQVGYTATDEMGRHAECSFSVEVVDEEPPIILTCPADVMEITGSQTLQVSWDTPRFKDNSEVVSMETSSQADGILATLDAPKEVWYQAQDEAGHHAYCNFTVSLKPYECPYMEPPLHGALLCESWLDDGSVCAVSCQEGYDFHRPPAALYVCSPSSGDVGTSEWQALDVSTAALQNLGNAWPQCFKKVGDTGSPSKKSIRYFDGPCSTEDAKSKLRKKYQRIFKRLEKVVPGFCSDRCVEEGVLVSCGMEDGGVDAGQDTGGDRRRRDVDKDALLGLLDKNHAFSLKSSLPANTLISRLQGVLLNDLDDSVKESLAPFFETLSSAGVPSVPGLACEEGHLKRGNICLECPVGTYHSLASEECVGCEFGTFQDEAGQTTCKACPEGANTTDTGARNENYCRYACPAGTYSKTSLQPCLACPAGTFQSTEGATSCQQCPDDAAARNEGASSLEECMFPCDAGSFSMSGYQPCIPCAPGWYQPMRKQHACLPCPDGSSSDELGAVDVTSCVELAVCHVTPCQHNGTCVNRSDISAFCQCVDGFTGAQCETNIDDCQEGLCMNGGTCHDEVAGYRCKCSPGFNGTNCEVDIDECQSGPCVHALACHDSIDSYRCECLKGYNGTNCEIDIDECASAPCQNGGTCQDRVWGFHCDCGPSYKGLQCETLAIPHCNATSCLNGGTCLIFPHGPRCDCAPGYTGDICDTDIDNCAGVTCLNGGSCVDEVITYRCNCPPGFAGALCGVNLDECESDPCMNGATCIDGINSFICNCTKGFTGLTCEESMDPCSSNPCENGGVCINEASDYRCQCLTGYSGKDCEVDIDDCPLSFCDNGGTCVDLVGGYWCRCADGFTGSDCEININDCRSNPCQNGGRCVDGINEVQCLCAAGFTGERCDVDVDDCTGVLCANNGSCVDEVDGFHCDCQSGFSGNLCETNIQDCCEGVCENGGTCLDGVNAFYCVCTEGFTGDRCNVDIDDCAGSPCLNAGQCIDGVNGYACSCARGFTGTRCETNIDNCIREPCRNGGSCVDEIDTFHCECIPGYTGRVCEFNFDECWSRPCMNKGRCKDSINAYQCFCRRGYTGTNCELDVDDCEKNSCLNGATCVDGTNSYTCHCVEGYSGRYCQLKDYCAFRPCLNNGVCYSLDKGYRCKCPENFRGLNCETLIPPCENHKCDNGGTCVDQPEGPARCLCTDGYTGTHCETLVDFCISRPCHNGGSCVNEIAGYLCDCPAGFGGRNCEVDVDECQSGPCQHNGTCQDVVNGYICDCGPGYTGERCSVDIDECIDMPCQNGGSCNDGVNSYSCECVEGFIGDNCQTNNNDCESAPCENGASCVDGINDYSCLCLEGFTGKDCEVNIDDCGDNPCRNGGSCVDGVNDFRCRCKAGFTGKMCYTNINDCHGILCRNGGSCIDYVEDFFCQCLPGFTGTLCEVNIDDCKGVLCGNGGTCIDGVNEFNCQCAPGFSGPACEINIDDCRGEPCQNGATCVDGVDSFFCQCPPGFAGEFCGVDVNECWSKPCLNGAQCVDGVDIVTCHCQPGFAGKICGMDVDECGSNPCLNGAQCVDGVDSFTCECLQGYTGDLCGVDVDECGSNPCLNGARCVDGVDSFTCQCRPGFAGKICGIDVDECGSNLCLNGAQCVDGVDSFTCECLQGYTGDLCGVDVDECGSNPCLNGARCVDGVDSFTCQCRPGFAGKICGIDVDECGSNPCLNGAQCVDGVDSFTCECLQGYTGDLCGVDVDECGSNPCLNGARCVDGVDSFTCQCLQGFTGDLCGIDVDECGSNPCLNGARCVDAVDSFTCECLRGFTGNFCGVDVDECHSNPCKNGAQCLDKVDGYLCICKEGFEGVLCENEVNECTSRPCKNGASCVDLINSFRCDCLDGYSGSLCETNIDECASNPCQNNGKCLDAIDSFSCVCRLGFSGHMCQVNIDDCATNRCTNGGRCVDGVNIFYCLCPRGFVGRLCQVNVDDCVSQPCQNGGSCLDLVHRYTCTCAAGFTGVHCQTNINDCRPNPCENGGRCVDGLDTYGCRCIPGFSGRHCEVRLDDCFSRPCQNGGRCIDGDQDYSCKCIPGFTGKDCEVDVDECASAPCLNEGICHDDVNSYMCECPEGFTGLTCEVNYDDCASSPCLNGAECQDLPRGFSCYCQDGYRGDQCEEQIGPCDASPCRNGGQCIPDDEESFQCLCRRGYQGAVCEEDIDDCLEHMEECLNGAVCEDRVDSFVCQCAPGYSGDNCQLKLSSDFDLIFGPSSLPFTHPIHMQPDLRELTLSLWIRPEGVTRTGPILSYIVYNEREQQSTLDHGAMNVALSLRDYDNMIVQMNSEGVETNFRPVREVDWHHVAFTWKAVSGEWRFYFDGTLRRQGTGLQTGGVIPGGGLLTLGREHDGIRGQEGSSGSFVGRLSQVNIWQFAMSDAEILSLFGSCGSMGDAMAWPQTLQDGITIYRRQPSQICRRIDDCVSLPCRNGATCRDLVDSYACDCADGFEGYACQVVSASCMVGTCLNGGRCHDRPRGPVCECTLGFSGPKCEEATDPCALLHCRNGGSCDLGEGNRPFCRCSAGFRGPVCNYDINECAVRNAGCDHACVNTQGSFHCECNVGFVLHSDGKSCVDSRHCRHNGIIRQANEEWEDACTHCQCVGGKATCTAVICFDPVCPKGQTAVREPGNCCLVCSAGQAKNKVIPTPTDGPNDLASCTVYPKGNFQSFDLRSFRFHGNCRYTMAQDCSSGSFSVHLELEHKDAPLQTRRKPLGKIVFVYLSGVKIELGPPGVKVDGRSVELPFALSEPAEIQIHHFRGNKIRVVSGVGLEVSWGTDGRVQVSVERSFRRRLCGLCGNFNGNKADDTLTKQQLPSRTNLELIHSWKVNGYEHCVLPAVVPESLSLPRRLVGRLPACAGLTYRSWREVRAKCDVLKQATFAECREVVDPRSFYELCQQDACSCGGNEPCYCEAIAAYAQECRRNGIIVREWRNSTICGMDCPETMIFDDCGPPCLETCYNTANLIELCRRLPCVARCQCAAGLAFHEGQCIMKSTCPNLVGSNGG